MTALPTFSRRARWAVPAAAVAIAGAVTAGVHDQCGRVGVPRTAG